MGFPGGVPRPRIPRLAHFLHKASDRRSPERRYPKRGGSETGILTSDMYIRLILGLKDYVRITSSLYSFLPRPRFVTKAKFLVLFKLTPTRCMC